MSANNESKNDTVKLILKKIAESSGDQKIEAIKEAANCPEIKVLEAIKELVNDSNPAVRYYAKKTFSSISAQISTRAMVEIEEKKAREALDAYKDAGGGQEKSDLISSKAREKIKFIQEISEEKNAEQAELLLTQLKLETDKYVIATMLKKLGKISDFKAVPALISFLSYPDPRVIANAVEALDEIGSEDGIAAMLNLLAHDDNRVKGNIVKALYKYFEKDKLSKSLILDKLKTMLNSREPWTQDSAVYALLTIGNETALELLKAFRGKLDKSINDKLNTAVETIQRKLDPEYDQKQLKIKNAAESAISGIDKKISDNKKIVNEQNYIALQSFIAKFKLRLMPPENDSRQNAIRIFAFSIVSLFAFFALTVFFNITYLLIYKTGHISEISAVSDEKLDINSSGAADVQAANSKLKILYGMIESDRYDNVIALIKPPDFKGSLTFEEKKVLDAAYAKKIGVMAAANEYDKACSEIERWSLDNSGSTLACVLKGQILLKNFNKLDDARTAFGKALKIDEKCSDAFTGLGDCAYYDGKYDESGEFYKKALTINENDYFACFGLGSVMAAKGDFAQAENFYKKSAGMNDGYSAAKIGLGRLFRLNKRYDESVDILQSVISAEPESARANFEIAETLSESGQTGECVMFYKRAFQLEPDNSIYRMAYIKLMFKNQIYQGLDDLLKAEIVLNPKNKLLYEMLGMTEYALNDSINAKETFEKYIKNFGASDTAYYYIAMVNEETGDLDQAVDAYKNAINVNKKHLPSYLNLSNLYLNRKKDYAAVDTTTDMGITNCGNNPALLYNKALGQYFQNKITESLLTLRVVAMSNDKALAAEARKLDSEIRTQYYSKKNDNLPGKNQPQKNK